MNWEELAGTWLSPNGISAIASVLTMLAAFVALGTWRKQVLAQPKAESDNLLINDIRFATTGLKAIVEHYRTFPPKKLIFQLDPLTPDDRMIIRQELHDRAEQVKTAASNVEVQLFRASALWGDGFQNFIIMFKFQVNKYIDAISAFSAQLDGLHPLDPQKLSEVKQILGLEHGPVAETYKNKFSEVMDIVRDCPTARPK